MPASPARAHPARVARARRPTVVFLGVEDDVRSRLAAALLAGRSRGRVEAHSMSERAGAIDPVVRRVVAEVGVDLGHLPSTPMSWPRLRAADVVVAIGYDCHSVPPVGRSFQDWCIDDPCGKDPQAVRYLRDAIDRRVRRLLAELDGGARRPAATPARAAS